MSAQDIEDDDMPEYNPDVEDFKHTIAIGNSDEGQKGAE